MKTTLYIKSIDLLLQIIAILVPLVMGIAQNQVLFYLLTAFFLIGIVQAASALLNYFLLNRFLWGSWRRPYNIALCIIVIGVPFFNMLHLPGEEYIVAPFYLLCMAMAVIYGCITIAEVKYLSSTIRRQQYTRI